MWQDVRYGLRTLRNSPGFTLTALLVLALGIGINTAIFGVVYAVLFRPPAVRAAHELRYIYPGDERLIGFVRRDYRYLRDSNDVFTDLIAVSGTNAKFGTGGNFRVLPGESVSANYFDVLGVPAIMGRTLSSTLDEVAGAPRVVVISYNLWVRQFNSDLQILGKTVRLTRPYIPPVNQWTDYTVVGVIGPEFNGVSSPWQPTQFWVPLVQRISDYVPPAPIPRPNLDTAAVSLAIGRIRRGVDDARVRVQIDALARQLKDALRPGQAGPAAIVRDGRRVRLPFDVRRQIVPERLAIGLMSVAGLVLLVASANLAGLLMARGVTRRGEIAVRLTLGATKWRLARQLFCESSMLAVSGGLLGLLLARALNVVFLGFTPTQFGSSTTYFFDVPLNLVVLAFTAGLCLGAGILVGLSPARQASKMDLLSALAGSATSVSRRNLRLRHWIVMPQVGLSIVLLIVASTIARPLLRAEFVNPGYQPDGLVFAEFDMYSNPRMSQEETQQFLARRTTFYRQLQDRLAGSVGISTTALSLTLPFQPTSRWVIDRSTYPNAKHWFVSTSSVTPEYFTTLGMQLVRGRTFDIGDRDGSPGVAIVCERLAEWIWPGKNPIGQHLGEHFPDSTAQPRWFEVIGVVNEVQPPLSNGFNPSYYTPLGQGVDPYARAVLVRGPDLPGNLDRIVRQAIFESDNSVEIYRSGTVTDAIASMLYPRRMAAGILALAGMTGLALACIGIYGVVSYSVAQRLREIGIRAALGAGRADLIRLVILGGAGVVGVGLALGLVGAYVALRLTSSLLIAIPTVDIATFAVVPLVLASVILAACYVPARRAGRVDPMTVLRSL